ncbi:Flp pilus assembly protein TadG [Aliiruegeria haliotis]|uniref:Flp pilus assembly protein TadG n=1 Tax=Aliiruegeria haliotis TaxID=1280846 RepID=A0A2T0RVQ9_9RHOB|nr:TadE/TadG family type IV pilus assembly protein [Aliiruegeria haliotis]PRY25261.1 Flp pilus assembly protein TadG [Aliiruegeria haliotis]
MLLSRDHTGNRASCAAATLRAARFLRREDGGAIIFTLYILICMLLAVGIAIDTVRAEYTRIKLQNTTDSAILAAADLEQELDPRTVVEDYFTKAGIDPANVEITVTETTGERTVSAAATLEVDTLLLSRIGVDRMPAPASGVATESVTDVEISLVLDNSGSMANNNDYRLDLLKPAAKEFIDTVMAADEQGGIVSVSLVPFATQVTAGKELLAHYNVSGEHASSHCVTFDDADFTRTGLSTTEPMERTGHFDPNNRSVPPNDRNLVCSVWESRKISPWSQDAEDLKARIESMEGQGWTSIEIGAKWGAALLDPSASTVLSGMVDAGTVNEELKGQPFSYERPNTMKVLVVMSDGENTNQWDIKDPFREGQSPVFMHSFENSKGKTVRRFSVVNPAKTDGKPYFWDSNDTWNNAPEGDTEAVQMTWPEVWATMGIKKYTEDLASPAFGGTANTHWKQIVTRFNSGSIGAAGTKNDRTSDICGAAKDSGVIVFTIGMDTYGQGDTTLADCASSDSNFFDVEAKDISVAFAAIARTINALRLTN